MTDTTDEIEVEAGKLVAGGSALVRRTGEPVLFVDGALPGERVRVQIDSCKKDRVHGHVSAVLEASPARIAGECPMYAAGCGGCQLQHATAESQAEMKTEIVRDALTRIAGQADAQLTFGGSVERFGYRTGMRLAVEDGKVALHRRHSRDLVALETCLIAHPALRELVEEARFPGAESVTLRVSATTGERIAWTHGATKTPMVPADVQVTIDGTAASMTETVSGMEFRVSARSFFQSGHQAAQMLASAVDGLVPDATEWILDAYAGVGVLGGIAATRTGARLTAVEDSRSSVKDARQNLAGLEHEVLKAEVATIQAPQSGRPDVVIADPARTGLGPSASRALMSLRAPLFVLVSCDPASFARDVKLLAEGGYTLTATTVLDLFPNTHHVETVAAFSLA